MKCLDPIYELALNPKIVQKAIRILEKTSEFDCLRELIDALLEEWIEKKRG